MGIIKLPGTEKNKKILLVILIIIAIGILSKDLLFKKENKESENRHEKQEEIIGPINADKSNTSNTTNEDAENLNGNSSKLSDNSNIKQGIEGRYSSKETELYNEAYEMFFSHQYTNAINKADELINKFPNNPMGYNIRGISKAYNGNYENGMQDIDKSLSINSNYGYARFNKALAYELYGKMNEALEWYNKDLEIEEYVWSYYGIASIYGRRGDIKNTMVYLNKAIQIDSGVKEVAKNEHDFDPVKDSEEFHKAVYN